jgi:hypothetical protein
MKKIARRRMFAAMGPLPPPLAANFSTGELAALWAVMDKIRKNGETCAETIDALAGRAGVERSTCQAAVRKARKLGLLSVKERRRRGQPSLPNVVRIADRRVKTWLAGRRKQAAKVGVLPTFADR